MTRLSESRYGQDASDKALYILEFAVSPRSVANQDYAAARIKEFLSRSDLA